MSNTLVGGSSKPWYREPWPWIIIGLLGATILASLATLWIAISNPDHAVVDDAEYDRIRSEMRAQDVTEQDVGAEDKPGDGDDG